MSKDWDFDEIVDREGTASMKWEPVVLSAIFGKGKENLLPLWVADMDFKCPTVVRKAMEKRLEHQIYGYSLNDPSYFPALISWYQRRHQWEIDEKWIITTPGIVPAINYIVQRFSKPGDKVLIQTPVYYPFAKAIQNNGRRILDNPLQIVGDHYQMDFADLEKKAKDPRAKMAILCSPHNPVGRVWTKEELEEFGNICIKNNILIISDEIHCDLIMPGFKHICFPTISDAFAQNSITGLAASKTFNLAGLHQSSIIIPNAGLRQELSSQIENLGFANSIGGTLFGAISAAAAFNGAEPWLEDLIIYLHDNFMYLKTYIETQLPGTKVYDLQGTYLVWVDFRNLGLDCNKMIRILEEDANVALDHGSWFGENGAGFERFNIACPRSILVKAAESVVSAIKKHIGNHAGHN
ncbi:MAG: pyridoxal phosphate-dependent aminotransferase [Deltaproteobacteria bacterium]|uniref:MalY/PatB family protein n=1 Tax=Desulfobacula sp. TaxID=2593537 RepID=UPI0019A8E8C8|nr:pyridoxal phosphate-dependent aminotransferase [Candidatus Desulfobacula maris]MBL6995949.1 pyridoxal phosphate-dependent aminotransferase [Desulfobacula sp.]